MNTLASQSTIPFMVRWTLLCAVGLAAGLALGLNLSTRVEALLGMMLVTPVINAIAGSVLSASQWLALWKRHRLAVLWIAASAVSLGLGMTVGIVLVERVGGALTGEQMRLFTSSPLVRFLSLVVVGCVSGLAVGVAQHLCLRRFDTAPRRWWLRCVAAFGFGLPGGGLLADVLMGGLQNPAGFVTFLGGSGLIVGLVTARAATRIAPADGAPRG